MRGTLITACIAFSLSLSARAVDEGKASGFMKRDARKAVLSFAGARSQPLDPGGKDTQIRLFVSDRPVTPSDLEDDTVPKESCSSMSK